MKNKVLVGLMVGAAIFVVGCGGTDEDVDRVSEVMAPEVETTERQASVIEDIEPIDQPERSGADQQAIDNDLAMAYEENDEKYCEAIDDEYSSDTCYLNVALTKSDLNLCERIEMEDVALYCQQEIAALSKE